MLSFDEFINESGSIACNNCGWKWESDDAGTDPYTCHKCGYEVEQVVTNESINFPHEIKSEIYWKTIIDSIPNFSNRNFVSQVFNTIMKKQNGFASDRQMAILRRAERGDNTPYSTKN
jgi:DNA-directed RNA polymerase subunit RPC12/RpoP